MRMSLPLIGITLDHAPPWPKQQPYAQYATGAGYSDAVMKAGGLPMYLPHHAEQVEEMLGRLDGLILTGGGDPDLTAFGQTNPTNARLMTPERQAFELAILEAANQPRFHKMPVLGVCLGMQLMALHAQGQLDPDMNTSMGEAAKTHQDFQRHRITLTQSWQNHAAGSQHQVTSSHRQCVADPGTLSVLAKADDSTIEALINPDHPMYLGVQWHPERTHDIGHPEAPSQPMGWGLIEQLVEQARV